MTIMWHNRITVFPLMHCISPIAIAMTLYAASLFRVMPLQEGMVLPVRMVVTVVMAVTAQREQTAIVPCLAILYSL